MIFVHVEGLFRPSATFILLGQNNCFSLNRGASGVIMSPFCTWRLNLCWMVTFTNVCLHHWQCDKQRLSFLSYVVVELDCDDCWFMAINCVYAQKKTTTTEMIWTQTAVWFDHPLSLNPPSRINPTFSVPKTNSSHPLLCENLSVSFLPIHQTTYYAPHLALHQMSHVQLRNPSHSVLVPPLADDLRNPTMPKDVCFL